MTTMTVVSEYESGTCAVYVHPHNGYYAGDFAPRTTCSRTRPRASLRTTTAHRTACLPRP